MESAEAGRAEEGEGQALALRGRGGGLATVAALGEAADQSDGDSGLCGEMALGCKAGTLTTTPLGCWQTRRHLQGVQPSSRYVINAEGTISIPTDMYQEQAASDNTVNFYSGSESELGSGNRE